jgi:murein DD-endopeptidase MepM/ murein hydrolase activator NlpD
LSVRLGLAAVVLTLATLAPAWSTPVRACDSSASDICKQIDQTQQQASDAQSQLDHIKSQISDLEAQDRYLSQLLQQIQGQLDQQTRLVQQTQAQVDDTSRQIRFTEADVFRQQANLAIRNQLLDQRVRTLAQHSNADYFSILLTSSSFTQMMDRVSLMQNVIAGDQSLIRQLGQEQDQVKGLQTQLDQKKAQLTTLLQEQQAEQSRLQQEFKTQKDALAYQQQLEAQLTEQRQAMESELAGLNAQLDSLRSQYQNQINGLGGTGGAFQWPVDYREITQPFGCTDLIGEPYSASCATHHVHTGIDIAAPMGAPIYAAADGVVVSAGWNLGGYGNRTIIAHSGGYTTTYNHQSAILVSAGDTVRQGQLIGQIGSTGYSTGPHLHFEILLNDGFQDPCTLLPGQC